MQFRDNAENSSDNRIDDGSVQTKACGLCGKEIELAKFRIHEVMCARMNYVCRKCGVLVPKAERETHDAEECGRPKEDEGKAVGIADVSAAANTSQTTGSSSGANDGVKTTAQKMEEEKNDAQPSSLMDLGATEDQDEATEREIQRLLQEDMNQYDAQNVQSELHDQDVNMPMTNYERSKLKTAQMKQMYGDCPELWPEGVRPADESKEQQLIGGDDDHPGFNYMGMAQSFTQSLGFGGANRTDDALPVNDNNGIMMPSQGLNRSNSQNGLPEVSNQSYSSTQIYANGQVYHSYNEWSAAQGQNPQPMFGQEQAQQDFEDQRGAVPEESSFNQLGAPQQQQFNQLSQNEDQYRQLQEQSEMEALEAQMLKEVMEQSMQDAGQQDPQQ